MKKTCGKIAACILVCLLLCSWGVSLAEDQTYTITLHYCMDGYPDETIVTTAGTKLNKALSGQIFQRVSRYPYGYDFDNWYMDAEATEKADKQKKLDQDMDLFAGWTAWDDARAALMNQWLEEMDLCKPLLNAMPAFTQESYLPFQNLVFKNWAAVSKVNEAYVNEIRALREGLVPVCAIEDVVWDIWGEQIPQEDNSEYDFYLLQDRADFRPVLTAFLLEDQSQVKGNIIACSGGGRTYRGNDGEGYATALKMNERGYNCFVLQYRILPYEAIDSYLDLQRAIRYIRYYAEEKGIGAIENIATIGYSAGSGVVLGQIAECYGNILPNVFYLDYVPDEIDRMDSDVTVAAPIYGPWVERAQAVIDGGNEHVPAIFAAVGTADGLCEGVIQGFLMLNRITPSELHVYEGVGHGFGMSDHFAGADQMPDQFDAFLQVRFGLTGRNIH